MAKELYTRVKINDGAEFLHWGELTREEAIRQTRATYQHKLEEARRFLETPDDQIEVRVQRGQYRVDVIKVLTP